MWQVSVFLDGQTFVSKSVATIEEIGSVWLEKNSSVIWLLLDSGAYLIMREAHLDRAIICIAPVYAGAAEVEQG